MLHNIYLYPDKDTRNIHSPNGHYKLIETCFAQDQVQRQAIDLKGLKPVDVAVEGCGDVIEGAVAERLWPG